MIKRVIDIGRPARASVRNGQLLIAAEDGASLTAPLEDLGMIIVDAAGGVGADPS